MDSASLLVMFPCEACLSGWQRLLARPQWEAMLDAGVPASRPARDRMEGPTLLGAPPARPNAYPRRGVRDALTATVRWLGLTD
jgi:hypothetical protein